MQVIKAWPAILQCVCLAVQDAAEWLRKRSDFHIAINLCAQDFSNATLPDGLRVACAQMQIHLRSLLIEATERVFLDVGQTRKTWLCCVAKNMSCPSTISASATPACCT